MMIKLIAIGKIKEDFLVKGILEYNKRLKSFCNFEIIELKETNTSDIIKNIAQEEKAILANIEKDDYIVTLEITGNNISSIDFSNFIVNHCTYNNKNLVFVIGGSNGLGKNIKSLSNYELSFSKMTFPHQLMRLIFVEQLYRAYTIINNQKYHK